MCNYPLMAANLMITFREDVPAAGTTETWMSRGLIPPRVEDGNESWEERAFAENTAALIGGIWPPRSYSCDFCKRDFRSAQALGGHMNVHRRDRALLRQSSSTHLAPPDHQRWSSPSPVRPEIPTHYQLPVFNSNFDENSWLNPVTPNPSIVSSSQLLPSSSIMPAPSLPINSHITYDPMQQQRRHEILPSTVLSISPYSPSEHAFPTFPSSPPVSNSLAMNIPKSLHSMEISGFDRRHGGFASSVAESAAVLRKLQQARTFRPCFPVTCLRKQNKSSSVHDIRINNLQHEEAINLDEDHDSTVDGLDLELRLGQTKS
jgi:hypothetical protein